MDLQPDELTPVSPAVEKPAKKNVPYHCFFLGFFLMLFIFPAACYLDLYVSFFAFCLFVCGLLLSFAVGMFLAVDKPLSGKMQILLTLCILCLPGVLYFLAASNVICCISLCFLTFLFSVMIADSYAKNKKFFSRVLVSGSIILLACSVLFFVAVFYFIERERYPQIIFFAACFTGYLLIMYLIWKWKIAVWLLRFAGIGVIYVFVTWGPPDFLSVFNMLDSFHFFDISYDSSPRYSSNEIEYSGVATTMAILGNKPKCNNLFLLTPTKDSAKGSISKLYLERAHTMCEMLPIRPQIVNIADCYFSLESVPTSLYSADIIFMEVDSGDKCPIFNHWLLTDFLHGLVPRVLGETLFVFRVPADISSKQLGEILAQFPCRPTMVHGIVDHFLLFRKNEPAGPVFDVDKSTANLVKVINRQKEYDWNGKENNAVYNYFSKLGHSFMDMNLLVKWWQKDSVDDKVLSEKLLVAEQYALKHKFKMKMMRQMLHGLIFGKNFLYLYVFAGLIVLYLICRYFIGWQPWHKPMFLSLETGFSLAFVIVVTLLPLEFQNEFFIVMPFVSLIALIFFMSIYDNPKRFYGKSTLFLLVLFYLYLFCAEMFSVIFGILPVLPLFRDIISFFELEYSDVPHKNRYYALAVVSFALALPVAYVVCMVDKTIAKYLVMAIVGLLFLRFIAVWAGIKSKR